MSRNDKSVAKVFFFLVARRKKFDLLPFARRGSQSESWLSIAKKK